MISNGPILESKFHSFIHLGLNWPKSRFLGTNQNFFGSTELVRQKKVFLENGDKIPGMHFSQCGHVND